MSLAHTSVDVSVHRVFARTVRILGEGFILSRKRLCTENSRARRPRRKAGRRRTRKVRGKSGACLPSGRGGVAGAALPWKGAAWYLGRSSSARMQRAQPSGCRAGATDAVPVARPCTTGGRDRRKRAAALVPARMRTSWCLPFAWQDVRPCVRICVRTEQMYYRTDMLSCQGRNVRLPRSGWESKNEILRSLACQRAAQNDWNL